MQSFYYLLSKNIKFLYNVAYLCWIIIVLCFLCLLDSKSALCNMGSMRYLQHNMWIHYKEVLLGIRKCSNDVKPCFKDHSGFYRQAIISCAIIILWVTLKTLLVNYERCSQIHWCEWNSILNITICAIMVCRNYW